MNATHRFSKFIATLAGLSPLIIALTLAQPGCAQEKAPPARQRIGVYDSRAVAVAYAGSTWQVKKMKELTAQMKKARETGDTNSVSRLETEGQAWQSTLKQQGFGTAPVDDLLAHVASELPAIQESAGVTGLISKWNKAELSRHPRAVQVDVTMLLVDAFQPTELQRKRAIEIQKTRPQKIKE